MTTTLPLFWDLSSASKKDRIDASVKLVGALEHFQAKFVPQIAAPRTSGSDDEYDESDVAPKSDELNVLNAQDVSYSIRRLIRGLASPRESSRLGFAVALTELLSRINTVTCSQILKLISESTKHQGSMSGQEERDVLFARLFGIMSMIQSGLIVRTKPLPTPASSTTLASTLEGYDHIIFQLIDLGNQKSWLRESAWFAISLTVSALYESDVSWKEGAVEKTLKHLFVENKIWSTEKIALALKLQDLYPGRDWKTFLSPVFKMSDLLSTGNLMIIARILKESAIDEDGLKDHTKAPSGTWKPQLNFAWDIILDQLLPGPNTTKTSKGSFQDFYRIVVDESLFSSTSSSQRKYWGFQVFQKALTRVTEANVPMLFTKNFMRSWINHLSKRDRYLHKVAQQTATEVQEFVKDKPRLAFAVILQLTSVNGNQQFDKLTRTKTVESILASLDAHGIQQYIDYLIAQTDQAEETSNIAIINSLRVWVIDSQLGNLIQNGTIPKEDTWVKAILDWLVIKGLFIFKKKSSKSSFSWLRSISYPPFSDDLRRSCRLRLLGCLSDLNNQSNIVKSGDKSVKAQAVASDGEFWIAKVISTISQLEEDKKHVALLEHVEDEEQALRVKAKETVESLRKISGDQQEAARGAELLILGTLLQRYCAEGDDENRYTDALQTCIDGASRMLLADNNKKKRDKKIKVPLEDAIDEPVDILVDTIIGFLEKSTAYIRTVGNEVFSLLSGSVKDTTIDLILAQLERRDPSQLAEDDDEDMEDSEVDKDDNNGSASDGEDESSQDDDPGDDPGDDSDDAEADFELRNTIEEALRLNGIEPATGETDSEDEELMDDDQMMAIDEQLVQVFRSRANEKKGEKRVDTQREATHFKNRVLDLVDIFLKKQSSSPLVLRLMIPLIDLFGGSSQDERQLSDKAKGIIRSGFSKARELPTKLAPDQVLLVASNIHTQARKARSSELLSILSLCSIYLSKALVCLKAEASLVELYKESLKDFATRKNSSLNPNFFQDFLQRFPTEGWCLRQDLLSLCKSSINAYRQCQILRLLELLVKLLPSMGEREKEVTEFMPRLRELLLDLTKDSCSQKINFTAAQMKDLFRLGIMAIQQTNRVSPEIVESIWQPQSWKSLLDDLVSSRFKNSPALHKMCEQIVRISQKPDASKKGTTHGKAKRGINEIYSSGEALIEDTKKNKRKKMKSPSQ